MSNTVKIKKQDKKEGGFTLIEVSIVLAIVGLLVGGALSFYRPIDQNLRTAETKERMAKVANALSAYALRNNRLPCPGAPDAPQSAPDDEPFGAERGSGTNGTNIGSCLTFIEQEGIVPYRTLGIRQEDVIDGFGSYFTYRVSPAFTDNDDSDDTVQDNCRSPEWMSGGVNINPDKARFCCPPTDSHGGPFNVSTDIIVVDQSGLPVVPVRDDANYGDLDSEVSDPDGNPLAVVYVLVSHGPNRFGKYLIGSTTNPNLKYEETAYGNGEKENMNDTTTYADLEEVSANTNAYFDDIILWRTQDSLLSELGTNSCALP